MGTAVLLIIGGLVVLVLGGEILVRGASQLAAYVGISPLVVGLTVVAFGTSSPELAVSLKASWSGQNDITVGNVVGSNIFNILFVLGVSALVAPLVVSSRLVRLEAPLLIATSIAMLLMGLDGGLGRFDGVMLFTGLIVYTSWVVYQSRSESKKVTEEYEAEFATPKRARFAVSFQLVLIIVGLVLLTLGARWLVDGSVAVARALGMSELLIGLTIVAIGTSLPEVATSVLATIRGERDIAVGNAIGSCLFNIMCVMGLAAMVSPGPIAISASALQSDIPIMIAVACACLPIFFTGHRIDRWEGGLFLGYYLAYTAYLILAATVPAAGKTLANMLLVFAIPLTMVTLGIMVWRSKQEPT